MSNNSRTRGMRLNAAPTAGNATSTTGGSRGMSINTIPRPSINRWKMSGITPEQYARARGFSSIVGNKFDPWLSRQMKTNEELLAVMPTRSRVNLKSRNNVSAFVNSARAKGGLELYKKFGGYYIIGHGVCIAGTPKFIVPKDKALIYIAKSGELLQNRGNNTMPNVEQKLLSNSGRIGAFIQGSSNVRGFRYGKHNMRMYLPGEEIYDQFVHLSSEKNYSNRNANAPIKLPVHSLGPSFGHIFKLPLGPGFSSLKPFTFNRNKNQILWNIPGMLSNRTVGLPNSERYERRRELWKISNILKNGPPGVYIVGTCRENVGANSLAKLTSTVNSTLRGMQEEAAKAGTNYFKNLQKANITDPTRGLPRTRNI